MSELLEHLMNSQFHTLFPGNVFTNATRFLYTALISAVDDDAGKVKIINNGFEWYKDDQLIGTYLGGSTPVPNPSYDEVFLQVLKYDEVIAKYILIESTDSNQTILAISQ